jgi:lipopolysaccharide heptosyltransferase II
VLFPNSLRTALEVWLAGIPRRVGFAGHHRRWLLNQIIQEEFRPGPIQHQVHRYLRLARQLGAPDAPPEMRKFLPRVRANGAPAKIGLCPGAEYGPAKRWLPERFAEVALAIAEQRAVQWVLFGTSADVERGATIVNALGAHCLNRIGQTTLEELAAELAECALLLTNDTGTMHLATLIGVPVVAVFGSTEPRLTGPLGTGHDVIRHQVECSPCFLRECPIDFRCMKAVSVEEVVTAVSAQLDRWQTARNPIVAGAFDN